MNNPYRVLAAIICSLIMVLGGLFFLANAASGSTPVTLDSGKVSCTTDSLGYCNGPTLPFTPNAVVITAQAPISTIPAQAIAQLTTNGFRVRFINQLGRALITKAVRYSYIATRGATSTPTTTTKAPTSSTKGTTKPPTSSTKGQTAIPLAASSPWLTTVNSAPLAGDSAAVVANLASQVKNYWGGIAAFNTKYYNNSFYPAAQDTPRQRMGFYDCHGLGYVPDNLFNGKGYFLDIPIPQGATPADGSDHIMSIYDASTDRLWEFWNVLKTSSGGYQACWGGRIDNVSSSIGYFPAPYGATATGLSISAGMISIDDVRHGEINHAMYFMTREAQPRSRLSWPAQRGDGRVEATDIVRQGQRLRLDPTLDLSKYNLTPIGHMVAVAAQKYGFIVADTSGAVGVIGESSHRYLEETGSDPWKSLLSGTGNAAPLVNFPWQMLQAIQVDYGKP
jgi:hypothetical protein